MPWQVNGRIPASDFPNPVEDLVRTFISTKWTLTTPSLSTSPPSDYSTKARLTDFDYDGYATYHIKVKEGITTFDNDIIMSGLWGFQTPIICSLTARRLSTGQSFQQLNNMRLELVRIIGQYNPDEISGIPSMRIEDPGDTPEAGITEGGQSVWHSQVTAMTTYFKNFTG